MIILPFARGLLDPTLKSPVRMKQTGGANLASSKPFQPLIPAFWQGLTTCPAVMQ